MVDNEIGTDLVKTLITTQFPHYADLPIKPVPYQGHDNHTFRLGPDLLIRLPTAETYALKVPIEQAFLPQLQPYLPLPIPCPLHQGAPSADFPHPFSIYAWLEGNSANTVSLPENRLIELAADLAHFLKALHGIQKMTGPAPGQHNWWRGAALTVYDQDARRQINALSHVIDHHQALNLWQHACATSWQHPPVWIHGDVAPGNLLINNNQLSAVIDFGGMAMGDPACDLVIAWTFFHGASRQVFIDTFEYDQDTWLGAKAWALWKATHMLCELKDVDTERLATKLIHTILQ